MMLLDPAPLSEPVCDPFYERRGNQWDQFINSMAPPPDSLSTPCVDCGEHLIVCACCRACPVENER